MTPRSRRRGRRLSITARLLVGTVALLLAAVAVTTATATVLLRGYLHDRVDGQLRALADGTESAPRPPAGRALSSCSSSNRAPSVLPSDFSATVLDADAAVLCEIGGSSGTRPPTPTAAELRRRAADGAVFSLAGGDETWRAVVLSPDAGEPDDAPYVLIALSTAEVGDIVGRLAWFGVAAGLVAAVVVAALAWWSTRVGLRPLTEIRESTRLIARGDLTHRVPEDSASAEVADLASALNVMLARVEDAFDHQRASTARVRQFAADASHELRTPLTSIQGYAQLYLQSGASRTLDPAGEHAMNRIDAEARRMSSIVTDLLLLARLDRNPDLDRELVDLVEVAHEVVGDIRVAHPGRAVSLAVRTSKDTGWDDPPAHVLGDPNRLRQVLGNLVDNAVTHTPNCSPVTVTVGRRDHSDGGTCSVEVLDQGPGMTDEVRQRVFDRFYRADHSRQPDGPSGAPGSGLGLAISAALVRAHSGTLVVDSSPEHGSRFTVELPGMSDECGPT